MLSKNVLDLVASFISRPPARGEHWRGPQLAINE